ncbi:MAG: hypothetical protein AB8D78_09385 [Akkermansiaceae bacterium]
MNHLTKFATAAIALGVAFSHAQDEAIDCDNLAASVASAITADPSEVLNVISEQMALFPGCACETVKAAINASDASNDLVGEIVYASVMAAPDQWELIGQCALAAAPDAAAEINAALIRAGKSALGNPLDFPGGGEEGVNPGGGVVGPGGVPIQPNQGVKVVTDPGPPGIQNPFYNYPRWRFLSRIPVDKR